MAIGSIAPRPRDLFIALLQSATAAHTAFIVVLTWLRPELGFSGVLSLMILPFLFFALGFLPIILILTLIRVGLLRIAPALRTRSFALTAIIAVLGIAIASVMAWMLSIGLRDDTIVSAVLFGSAVGGVIAGLKLGTIEGQS